ncbi:SRPBCC family protein [Fulvivirga lutimaris]|uniref:SRPBCC family protein n=1 Tax=Fulvivirga lutimaris TaxID=1819566 RepID=UPI0012BC4DC9|nr:SRPBCC family protein [Fulvivirga lutimaris]MTI38831.1 SRPBCC family protein [Fulvivirga lutimaris]
MKKDSSTQLKASVIINAPQELVWKVVRNFGKISDFHPLVKSSKSINEKEGLGAKRYCELLPMGAMEEEVVQWTDGVSFTAEVIGGKMLPPCHYMKGMLELESRGSQTRVTFTFNYLMKLGLIGRLMNAIIIKPQFKKAPPKYVNGLKNYIESMEASRV